MSIYVTSLQLYEVSMLADRFPGIIKKAKNRTYTTMLGTW